MKQAAPPVLIGFHELHQRYGAGRSAKAFRQAVWRWTREGRFPAAVEVGPWARAWRVKDVEEWEANLRRVAFGSGPARGGA